MSKKINDKKNINKTSRSKTKNNKVYRFNILMLLLMIIFVVWGLLLLNRYNDYKKIKKKIDNVNILENNIILLNDSYALIEDKVKKIDEFKIKNDMINKDIDKIKKEIEDLDYKISKYSK